MVKTTRITYNRRHCYNTKSNQIRKVKTPGGKLVAQYISKRASGPKCGDTGVKLNGIPALRPKEYRGISKRQKTVSRCYGGSLSGAAVKARIVRAFLIEEQKIVKKVLQEKSKSKKKKGKKKGGKK